MKRIFIALGLLFGLATFAEIHYNLTTPTQVVVQEKTYKKIDVSQVNKDAAEKIRKDYGDYTISEAAVADDGEYKLTLKKDQVTIVATFTSSGDLVKILE